MGTICGVFRNISVTKIVSHPNYVPGAGYYDVAVVHLDEKLVFNQFIKPICLPVQNASNWDAHMGKSMRLAGKDHVLHNLTFCDLIPEILDCPL